MTCRTLSALIAVSAASLLLAGCAAAPSDSGDGVPIFPAAPPSAIAAEGEVLALATVLQRDGEATNLCLAGVMESYPPQCSGPQINGWDWNAIDGDEAAEGVRWGTYAVQGTWNGEQFTVTQPPIMLALYDPLPIIDPHEDPVNKGATSEALLLDYQSEISDSSGEALGVLSSYSNNGYLFVGVIYDDGQIQDYFDEAYGKDVVVVQSQLRPVAP